MIRGFPGDQTTARAAKGVGVGGSGTRGGRRDKVGVGNPRYNVKESSDEYLT